MCYITCICTCLPCPVPVFVLSGGCNEVQVTSTLISLGRAALAFSNGSPTPWVSKCLMGSDGVKKTVME